MSLGKPAAGMFVECMPLNGDIRRVVGTGVVGRQRRDWSIR